MADPPWQIAVGNSPQGRADRAFHGPCPERKSIRMGTRALEGKVAVITGGTSGIGARTAELFVAEGARVVIAGRREEKGKRFAHTLGAAASFTPTDLSVESDVEPMIAHAVTSFGRLECLINNTDTGSPAEGN